MYKFNKILVGLDQTEIDKDLIRAASDVCELSGSKEVFFINIIKDFNFPENLRKEFPGLLERAIDERKNALLKEVNEHFTYKDATVVVNVIVEQGQVTKTLLKIAAKEKADLFILGRKSEKPAGGVLLNRIARRAACSLLIIPKGKRLLTETILVPSDFSDYSKNALEKAFSLARKSKTPSEIIVQNVYQVPVGYHYTGKTFKEFAEIMKANAERDFHAFVANMHLEGLNVRPVYSLDKDEDVIARIFKMAKRISANLIVIGAKGRTATTALFIGSKAERLIQLDEEIPILVIRPKGKMAGIMDYLQEL